WHDVEAEVAEGVAQWCPFRDVVAVEEAAGLRRALQLFGAVAFGEAAQPAPAALRWTPREQHAPLLAVVEHQHAGVPLGQLTAFLALREFGAAVAEEGLALLPERTQAAGRPAA